MKILFIYLIISLPLIGTVSLQAQVLSVGSGTDFNVAAGTVIGADSLDITPNANFTLNGTSLSHNRVASNAVSFPYIGSVYQFSNTTNPFSGSLQFVYNNATLNSIPTSYLSQHIHDGNNWNTEPVAALNTGSTYLQTTGLSGVSLNELTLATPPTWTGTSSNNWATAGNWISNYTPISTSNAVIPSGVPNNPVVSTSVAINGLTIKSGGELKVTNTLALAGDISNDGTFTATNGTIVLNGTAAQTINTTTLTNDTLQNLIINNSAGVTLGGPLYVTGTLTPSSGILNTGGYLTLVSTSAGTARIAQGSGSYLNGNITAQRYIPAKTARKYSYIGSPVTESIRNSWQQQIYVTGYGAGGVPCGTTTGDGGSTDKYNSNGFDVTQNNSPTIYNYNATLVNGSRNVGIANTESTNLTPGTGYIVNVRGDRNSATVSCTNQLASAAYAAPEAVTLSATGTVTTGSLTVALNDPAVHGFTLLANPYPSPLSFSAFQADNSKINNNMWTYSPSGNGNYTTYSNGLIANGATGFDNTSGNYLASGQAFFVQANAAGSVTFQESHKAAATIPNTKYFGNNANQLIRIGLKSTTDNSLLDEILVSYSSNGSKSYMPSLDASSLSSATQSLASLKDTKRLAIATHPLVATVDTTQLGIKSSTAGSYRLSFSDYQNLDNSQSITLVDKFLGTTQDIRTNQVYDFKVTSDTASVGNNRFMVLVGAASALPVNFTAISATKAGEKVNVQWRIANEANIASYEVERSTNSTLFATITTKKAAATNAYSIEDANLPSNITTLYYRIKAIGTEGTTKYSSIAKLTTHNSQLTTIAIYPNPVQRKLNITLSTAATGNYDVRIASVTGKEVYSKTGTAVTDGKLSLDASNLASGVYVLELTDKQGNKHQEKFVKE